MKLWRVVSGHDGTVSEVDGSSAKNTFVAFAALLAFYGRGARRFNHLQVIVNSVYQKYMLEKSKKNGQIGFLYFHYVSVICSLFRYHHVRQNI